MGEKTPARTVEYRETKRNHKALLKAIEVAKEELELKRLQLEIDAEEFKAAEKAATKSRQCTYVFNTSVSDTSVEACRATLDQWHIMYPDEPFTIEFNSPGGSVFAGWALFDTLRENSARGHHVTTVGLGWAASMAGILLQAGDTRLIGRESYLMIHEVATGAIGKVSELQDSVDLARRLNERAAQIFSDRSKSVAKKGKHLTAKQIIEKAKRIDWWLSSAEALELGFVDGIRG